jgi:hypothetical protein
MRLNWVWIKGGYKMSLFTFAIEKHYKNLHAGTPTLFERNGSGAIPF